MKGLIIAMIAAIAMIIAFKYAHDNMFDDVHELDTDELVSLTRALTNISICEENGHILSEEVNTWTTNVYLMFPASPDQENIAFSNAHRLHKEQADDDSTHLWTYQFCLEELNTSI